MAGAKAGVASCIATFALLLAPPAHASDHPANVQWETYLPAMGGPTGVQPHGVQYCRRPSIRCVDRQIRRMRRLQRSLGCDHRAVFATTYLEVTKEIRRTRTTRPAFYRDWPYLFTQDALFANVYFNTLRDWSRGREVPGAWRVALETAASGDANGTQDMLLGINAHVQNDMPFVVAALGIRTPSGETRKIDHDRGNEILDAAYENVVREVNDRYDPILATTNPSWSFWDDVAGLEMVKGWREGVWRNAERLLAAGSDAERREVALQIEQHAEAWARSIATPQMPGYRTQRDGYCRTR